MALEDLSAVEPTDVRDGARSGSGGQGHRTVGVRDRQTAADNSIAALH
jgi:hypothetical protein